MKICDQMDLPTFSKLKTLSLNFSFADLSRIFFNHPSATFSTLENMVEANSLKKTHVNSIAFLKNTRHSIGSN